MICSLLIFLYKDALSELPRCLEMAQRLNPRAVCAVVATKADLYCLRKISTEDAVVSGGMTSVSPKGGKGAQHLPFFRVHAAQDSSIS